jgi:SAM-dependent methyltransferase
LWKDRFRNIFNENSGSTEPPSVAQKIGRAGQWSGKSGSAASSKGSLTPVTRQSSGTEQFFASLRTDETLSILDMTGANQANISYLTGLGHRLSSEDLLGAMDQCFGDGDFFENQTMPSRAQRFFDQSLLFPENHFDAALVWDTLQFFAPGLLEQVIEKLMRVMRPGGLILAFFSSNEKVDHLPLFSYRIQDAKTLLLMPRGTERQVQYANNRSIERLFGEAQSLKFFLSRDHLREVLIRK